MATYTTTLRKVCEEYGRDKIKECFMDYELTDYLTEYEIGIIESRGTWSKERLADKIINHYYFREIGFETPEMFMYYVRNHMKEIMDEYLQLIYSASIKIDPLINVDYTESYKMSKSGDTSGSTNSSSSGLSVNSDTPQGQINKDEILKGKYASSTGAGESSSSGTDTGKYSGMENWERRKVGNDGIMATQQALIKQFRKIIIGIDKDIIKECNVLFMGIY